MDKDKWGVHAAHCCLIHGCKYGDEDCPVGQELVAQKYPCEYCKDREFQNIKEMNSDSKLFHCEIEFNTDGLVDIKEVQKINYELLIAKIRETMEDGTLPHTFSVTNLADIKDLKIGDTGKFKYEISIRVLTDEYFKSLLRYRERYLQIQDVINGVDI